METVAAEEAATATPIVLEPETAHTPQTALCLYRLLCKRNNRLLREARRVVDTVIAEAHQRELFVELLERMDSSMALVDAQMRTLGSLLAAAASEHQSPKRPPPPPPQAPRKQRCTVHVERSVDRRRRRIVRNSFSDTECDYSDFVE
jgi:hypothetical protein